jgi:hypothetical protein
MGGSMTLLEMENVGIRLKWRLIKQVAVQCYCYGVSFNDYVLYALREAVEAEDMARENHGE